jgi:curli biogenesis system outer membrane secretion channel CsgG
MQKEKVMKKIQWVLIGLGIFCFLLANTMPVWAADPKLRYSILVKKFENKSNWSGQWDLGDAWGAVLTDTLNQTGKFIVLGENDMREAAMEEQDFAASDRAAGGGKKVATGQMTPAQLIVKGDITHFAEDTAGGGGGLSFKGIRLGGKGSTSEINVVMYIVDSSTGQIMASKKCYGKISNTGLSVGLTHNEFDGDVSGFKKTNAGKAMEAAVDEGVQFMTEKISTIPWTASVVIVKGDKVYLNRGTREGVEKGMKFDVGQSETVRDPDTGEVLDENLDKVGSIQVESVKEKISICKVLSGKIQKGMTAMFPE